MTSEGQSTDIPDFLPYLLPDFLPFIIPILSQPENLQKHISDHMSISIAPQKNDSHPVLLGLLKDLQEAAQQDVVDVEVGESRQGICQNVHHLIAAMSKDHP